MAILTLLFAAAPTQARVHQSCYPPGSTTIAQDAAGRFYSLPAHPRAFTGHWYTCAFRQDAPHRLPFTGHADTAVPNDSTATVAGRYLAFYVMGSAGPGVKVFDMVTGHKSFSRRLRPLAGDYHLVLKSNGSVAWIARFTFSNPPGNVEVYRHDSTGTTIVGSGAHISSLAADGQWLYWMDAGSPRAAPFH